MEHLRNLPGWSLQIRQANPCAEARTVAVIMRGSPNESRSGAVNITAEQAFNANAVYCINLDRRPERWQRARRAIDEAGFPSVQRFSAVDGASIGFDDPRLSVRLAAIVQKTHMAPLGVKRGVIGCYLSHLALWQQIFEQNLERCIIFEDDVKFMSDFPQKLTSCLSQRDLHGVDLLFFGYLKRGEMDADGRLRGRIWGTQSYFLTRAGARKLLARALPVCEAIDEYIEHAAELNSDLGVYCLRKPLVVQNSIVSDVQPISYAFGHRLSRLTMLLIAAALTMYFLFW